ncbi:caffeoyl-CoA O-methyltransferase 1 [Biomphalaria pfeifferi]|uniref:Caffeoyl-CoA O-methyltransferase 1 n=1 Tax=Biomphalaria pfeifferi TaxID=112525 RepID=A0AAD8BGT8_BIOPF|nr:caffeoyl-CoA O-methyltransferase 1 [Biomphalaria pfeifferi]
MSHNPRRRRYHDPAIDELIKAIDLAESTNSAPEVIKGLKYALELVQLRDDFTKSSTSAESEACKNILEETLKHDWAAVHAEGKTTWRLSPGMMSGSVEGQFLKSFVSAQKAKRILDVGMFTGYSALSMAEALPADGEVVTIDQDDYLKTLVEDSFLKKSPHGYKIKIIIGKAPEVIQQLSDKGEKFDIIFLDADKSEYILYLKYVFEKNLLAPGGSVLVDNAYRHGDGYRPDVGETPTKIFAQAVSSDSSLHSVLLPIRDGILLIRRKSDVEGTVP